MPTDNQSPTKVGYARVSTLDQDPDLQIRALRDAGVTERLLFVEHASGRRDDRPELARCLDALRPGDELLCYSISRLSRSVRHLTELVTRLSEEGVTFRSLTEPAFDTTGTNPTGTLVFRILCSLAEFEANLTRARTRDGLAAARARGVTLGRPTVWNDQKARSARAMLADGMTMREVGTTLGVSRPTLYRHLGEGAREIRRSNRGTPRSEGSAA